MNPDELLTPSGVSKLEAALADLPKANREDRGPRNLPKPDARKRRRLQQKRSRKANR